MTTSPPDRHRIRVPFMGTDDFVVVLVLLTAAYVLYAISTAGPARVAVSIIYVVALGAAIVAVRPARRTMVLVAVAAVGTWAVALLLLATASDAVAARAIDAAVATGLLITLVLVVDRVLSRGQIGFQALAGALSAYLLIGLFFAAVFGIVAGPDSTTFFASHEPANPQSLQYFSFTTLATLGYGDLTAAAYPGRGLATMEAIVGQIFLATLVARLVTRYERRRRAGEADDDPRRGP